jgi:hypothetical protein
MQRGYAELHRARGCRLNPRELEAVLARELAHITTATSR